jgi:molybdopterin-binding protein
VLSGVAHPSPGGLTALRLDGGGEIFSTDRADGATAASVFPWEVTVEAPGSPLHGSAQNSLAATVTSVTPVGNRVRVGLSVPQPLVAEVTQAAVHRLSLAPGARVEARWKATATRLVPL